MKFWRLQEPEYESDYQEAYVNGYLEHPFGLPGVQCDVCGQTWGGSRILPCECPIELRDHARLKDAWAIPLEEYKTVEDKVLEKLKSGGVQISDLFPGDAFQPCYLDVPSKPRVDFLWASPGSLVVSEKMKRIILEHCPEDVACCNVILRKIGKCEADVPAPIPPTGEPGDIIDEVPVESSVLRVGPYHEICIQKESGWPPGGRPESICPGCKRREVNQYKREIRMTNEMWKGDQMFFLATTLYVLVTEDLREAMEKIKPTNVIFSEM
jgi:hypothetical protein